MIWFYFYYNNVKLSHVKKTTPDLITKTGSRPLNIFTLQLIKLNLTKLTKTSRYVTNNYLKTTLILRMTIDIDLKKRDYF